MVVVASATDSGSNSLSPIRFACEHCGQRLKVGAERAGKRVQCPKCRSHSTVPQPDRSSEAAAGKQRREPSSAPQSSADSTPRPSPAPAQTATASPPPAPSTPPPTPPPAPSPRDESAQDPEPGSSQPGSSAPRSDDATPARARAPAEPSEAPPSPSGKDAGPIATDIPPQETVERSADAVVEDPFTGADRESWEQTPTIELYDETEWVYEDEAPPPPVDPDKLAVSRKVVYGQGALLFATAITAFVLGVLWGRGTGPTPVAAAPDEPCQLSGEIEFVARSLGPQPDLGAIVIAVPRGKRFDVAVRRQLENVLVVPNENDPLVHLLREQDGDLAVADRHGKFQLEVPRPGEYHVLILSAGGQRPRGESLDKQHLAEIGNYFGPAARLLGDRQYQWRTESLTKDEHLEVLFP